MAHQRLERYTAGYSDYEAAHKLTGDAKLWAGMAYCLGDQGFPRNAVDLYTQAIADGFENAEIYNDQAFSYIRLGKTSEAFASASRTIVLNDRLQAPFLNRASAALNECRFKHVQLAESALADIERAIEIGPPSGNLFYVAASLHALASRTPQDQAAALTFLDEGMRNGLKFKALFDDVTFAHLRQDPRFLHLAQLEAKPGAAARSTMLLDPLANVFPASFR